MTEDDYLLELLEIESERRRTFEPLRLFKPNGAQIKFIEAFKKQDSEVIVFPAGNWCGKTSVAIAIAAAIMWPELAEHQIFNHPIFHNWPYAKNIRIVSTPSEMAITGSVQKEILQWWPINRYKASNQGKMYPSLFSCGRWTVNTMTYDQQLKEFEGGDVGLFILNEPPPEEIFDACTKRQKHGGKILMPMTPLSDSAWVWDKLIQKQTKGTYIVYGDTEDNCIEHGINGVLPHSAIEAMANRCNDEDERNARLHGKFAHLTGCIFKTFKREVHVVPEGSVDLNGKDIYMVVDPAIGKPLAAIWAAIGPAGDITIYDEWPNYEFTGAKDPSFGVAEYKEQFKIKESNIQGRNITRILDRHFGNARRTMGGLTLKQEFGNIGLDFIDSYSISDVGTEVETGIIKIKDALRYDTTKPIGNLNQPKLKVVSGCVNTIHALERWARDPKTGKPKESYKDFADCVRYLVMSNPEIWTPQDWSIESAHYGVNNN